MPRRQMQSLVIGRRLSVNLFWIFPRDSRTNWVTWVEYNIWQSFCRTRDDWQWWHRTYKDKTENFFIFWNFYKRHNKYFQYSVNPVHFHISVNYLNINKMKNLISQQACSNGLFTRGKVDLLCDCYCFKLMIHLLVKICMKYKTLFYFLR